MNVHRTKVATLVVALWLSSGTAFAQDEFDLERFRPALDHFGFLAIQGTTTPGPKRWNLGLWFDYMMSPLKVPGPLGETTIINNRLQGDLQFQVGIGGRGAIAIELPFVAYQNGLSTLTGAAIAGPRFTGRVRVYGKPTEENTERSDGPGVGLLVSIPVPVGTARRFVNEEQFTFDLHALADFHILGAGGGMMFGWRFRANTVNVGNASLKQELLYGISIKPPIPLAPNLFGLIELRGSSAFRGRESNALEGDIGIRYSVAGFTITGSIGTGFVRGIAVPSLRAVVGVSWMRKSKDVDQDGIPDDRDGCPRLPEDIDGFEDQDGCLDPDNDNDMIPDADDLCPNDEALEGRDEDEDGCTDPE